MYVYIYIYIYTVAIVAQALQSSIDIPIFAFLRILLTTAMLASCKWFIVCKWFLFLMLAPCVRAQHEEPEDTSSVVPLLCLVFFAFIGVVAMMCILVRQVLQSWKRWRERPSLHQEVSVTTASKSEHQEVPVTTASKSNSRISSSRTDTQSMLRRGQALHAVWARDEEQKWQALNSRCITCKQPIEESLAATTQTVEEVPVVRDAPTVVQHSQPIIRLGDRTFPFLEQLEAYTVYELKAMCRARGLPVSGLKRDHVLRIEQYGR
jgi:hypothetical protein